MTRTPMAIKKPLRWAGVVVQIQCLLLVTPSELAEVQRNENTGG